MGGLGIRILIHPRPPSSSPTLPDDAPDLVLLVPLEPRLRDRYEPHNALQPPAGPAPRPNANRYPFQAELEAAGVPAFLLAQIPALIEDHDEAFRLLEVAYEEHFWAFPWFHRMTLSTRCGTIHGSKSCAVDST